MIEIMQIRIDAKFTLCRIEDADAIVFADAELIGIGEPSEVPVHQQTDALQIVCFALQTLWEQHWDSSCVKMTAEFKCLRSTFTITADEQSLHEDVWVNGAADLLQEV